MEELNRSPEISPRALRNDTVSQIADVLELNEEALTVDGCFHAVLSECRSEDWTRLRSIGDLVGRLCDAQGRSLYQLLIEQKTVSSVQSFLEKNYHENCVEIPDHDLGIHYAAQADRSDLFDLLLEMGSALNGKDEDGKTPVHAAVEMGSTKILKRLVEEGASIKVRYRDPATGLLLSPCSLAVARGKIECLNLLVEKATDKAFLTEHVDNLGNLLHVAVTFHQRAILEHLLTEYYDQMKGLVDGRDARGNTPVSLAVSLDDPGAVRLLWSRGANLELPDYDDRTPLHQATIGQKAQAFDALLQLGVELTPVDIFNKRPITYLDNERGFRAKTMRNRLTHQHLRKSDQKKRPPSFEQEWPENLVFQGGSVKGIAYVGILEVLQAKRILEQVTRVAGTSAGSIVAGLVAVGYRAPELKNILVETPFTQFLNQLGIGSGGLFKTDSFLEWFDALVEKKVGEKQFTFGQLREKIKPGSSYRHLHVFATKMGNNRGIIRFSSEDPKCDMLVVSQAVCASMSIPGFFTPTSLLFKDYKGTGDLLERRDLLSYADGGILANLPIEAFDRMRYVSRGPVTKEEQDRPAFNTRTVGFSLYSPTELANQEDTRRTWLIGVVADYLKSCSNAEDLIRKANPYNAHRIVRISNVGVGTLDFKLSTEKVDALVKSGKTAALKFFQDQATKPTDLSSRPLRTHKDDDLKQLILKLAKKAEDGDERVRCDLGQAYYRQGYYKDAIKHFDKGREAGFGAAIFSLAICYDQGHGAPRDPLTAYKLYKQAGEAQKASPEAQCALGQCFLHGKGIKRDRNKAVEWFRKAADQKHPKAQLMLAWCYLRGLGTEKDAKEAFKLFTSAAKSKDPRAQCALAQCYDGAKGVKQDLQKAFALFQLAADRGDKEARCNLGWYLLTGRAGEVNYKEAVRLSRLATKQGVNAARFNLGILTYFGKGTDKNHVEGLQYLRQAASSGELLNRLRADFSQGDPWVAFQLGLCYHLGLVIDRDIEEATKLYKFADTHGCALAHKALKHITN